MSQDQNNTTNYSNEVRVNKILAIGLISGAVIFSLLILLVVIKIGPPLKGEEFINESIFFYVPTLVGIICIFFSTRLYKREIANIRQNVFGLGEKLNAYRATLIKCMAICEGGALFSVISIFLTGELKIYTITAVMIGFMLLKMPSKDRIIKELELNYNEQEKL